MCIQTIWGWNGKCSKSTSILKDRNFFKEFSWPHNGTKKNTKFSQCCSMKFHNRGYAIELESEIHLVRVLKIFFLFQLFCLFGWDHFHGTALFKRIRDFQYSLALISLCFDSSIFLPFCSFSQWLPDLLYSPSCQKLAWKKIKVIFSTFSSIGSLFFKYNLPLVISFFN